MASLASTMAMLLVAVLLLGYGNFANGSLRNAITNPYHLWPNGMIPFTFHPDITAYDKLLIMAGMKQFTFSTFSGGRECITFVPRTNETDYVEFKIDPAGYISNYGRNGGKQEFHVEEDVDHTFLLRHLMFLVGFYPETSRTDRDKNVEIMWDNIRNRSVGVFKIKYSYSSTFNQSFDFESAAIYDSYSFAIDPSLPTIKARQGDAVVGRSASLSNSDVLLIQNIYNCTVDTGHNIDILGPSRFECHFHHDLCQFKQDTTDNFDWVVRVGPSPINGTGPQADFSSGSGGYAVAVAQGHHNQIARMDTPSFPPGTYCFTMALYKYGRDVYRIRIYQMNADGSKFIFSHSSGSLNNQWYKTVQKTVSSPNSPVTLRVEATMGSGDLGDVAIDDFVVYRGKCINWYS